MITAVIQSHKYLRIYTPLLMWDTLFQRIYFNACGQAVGLLIDLTDHIVLFQTNITKIA